ncbi:hypothetical protein [Paenibacillus sp. Marseille-Q4541]|uniref:hypothetical protein n=1 Tax=Paenibacillus sp. Marseille-Q4541 TaxID=2831522 RepID=UPI001BAAB77F|nr:hypothetical protein [Paenibacillus sp. Marseille-Q4541]
MNTSKICKITTMLSLLFIITACGSGQVPDASDQDKINPATNQTEGTSDHAVGNDQDGTEMEAENEFSAYPFLVWANGGTFKIILDEALPNKLIGKKLGAVSSTLTEEEVGRLEEGQTYQKLDRIDGESNYLKQGSSIYQLKKADANEVVLVEHQGSMYKAVRIGD